MQASINGYSSIERNYQRGKNNLFIPSFSLNTCISIVIGDINHDDIVNIIDIIMVINFILNENIMSDKQFIMSDINQDEVVDVNDAVVLISIILGQ